MNGGFKIRLLPTLQILGLGDVIVKDKERIQPRAGRLDILLQDAETNLRYEVEIQLGSTDESHIIRTIEYWDIERKRYPQYDHVAVIVAEDITSRFLNVISLFNGMIPIIAIQMNALKLSNNIGLSFTTVVNQLSYGLIEEDEEVEEATDRAYWENRGSKKTVTMADQLLNMATKVMPHNLVRIRFGFFHWSKHDSTTSINMLNVTKYWLCVAMRLASFHTRSIGASCGLYGGKNTNLRILRYFSNNGASSTAWWYRALSRMITTRLPRVRWRNNCFRKSSNVSALNLSQMVRTNLPVFMLTAPKHATDLRVGACCNIGSFVSGGTHIRLRVPCCWKWHSSRLHISVSFFLARRRSFFKNLDLNGIGLGYLRSWLTQPKPKFAEHTLALSHTKLNMIALFQMFTQHFAIPKVLPMSKIARIFSQVSSYRLPLTLVKPVRSARMISLSKTIKATHFELFDPPLDRPAILTEQSRYVSACMVTCNQKHSVKTMIITRLICPINFLANCNLHQLSISNYQFPHCHLLIRDMAI